MTSGVKGINIKEDDYIVAALPLRDNNDTLAIFSSKGLGKRIPQSDLVLQKRGGKGLMCYKIEPSVGTITSATLVDEEDKVLILSNQASICIEAKELPILGRSALGNQVIKTGNITSVSKV